MDTSQILSFLGKIGEGFAWLTQKAIVGLSNLGVNTTPSGAKVLNIIIMLLAAYLVLKFATTLKTLVKWSIIILLIFLAVSTGISFTA